MKAESSTALQGQLGTREYLSALGIYDYRHRVYHPGLGRFMQVDPMGLHIEGAKLSAQQTALYVGGTAPAAFSSSELNLYRYCHNNPVNNVDPLGLDPMVVDQQTDVLAHQGLNLNLAKMESTQWFGGMCGRYEFSTTVLQAPEGKILSETRTDNIVDKVAPPEREGMTSLADEV